MREDDIFVELEKCCKMRIWTQKSALIQPRTSVGKSDAVVACDGVVSSLRVVILGHGPGPVRKCPNGRGLRLRRAIPLPVNADTGQTLGGHLVDRLGQVLADVADKTMIDNAELLADVDGRSVSPDEAARRMAERIVRSSPIREGGS